MSHYSIAAEEKALWSSSAEPEAVEASRGVPETPESHTAAAMDEASQQAHIAGAALPESAAALEPLPSAVPSASPLRKPSRVWNWLLPLGLTALLVAVSAAIYMLYKEEMDKNELVLKLQSEAKTMALAGDYANALSLLAEAIAIRPDFAALEADESIVEHVAELERLAKEVEFRLQTESPSSAESGLNHLRRELGAQKEPVYDKLRQKLAELNLLSTLATLNREFYSLSTIKGHTDMLNVVNGLIGEEAEELREKLKDGIIKLTIEEADKLLSRKSFTGAAAVVNRSLAWLKDETSLIALQQRINWEQNSYIEAEQQRIEQAMQVAAAEDLINQTAAVEVVEIEQMLDEFGDLTIVGKLKNAATRAIYSVVVDYTVKSASGEALASGSAVIAEDYIESGEAMSFTATVYGIYEEDTTVTVDHATWYLD